MRHPAIKLACCLAGLLGACCPPALAGAGQTPLATLDAAILVQVNAVRKAHDLVPLRPNGELSTAAERHTAQMIVDGYFGHAVPPATTLTRHIAAYYRPAGYRSWLVGENLLWASPGIDARAAVERWMASPDHRRNILDARWREIGIAAIQASTARGAYGGRTVTVITTDFATRRR